MSYMSGWLSDINLRHHHCKNKLVGRAESIHQQRKWRYCFSNYTTRRVGDFPVFGKASTEVRDRTVARTVPRCARHGR